MKRLMSCAAAVAFMVPAFALASAWHVVFDGYRQRIEIDKATLKKSGNVVTVWAKNTFVEPQALDNGVLYDVQLGHDSIDCANDSFWSSTTTFSRNDKQVLSTQFPKADIPPDSIIQIIEKAVCP